MNNNIFIDNINYTANDIIEFWYSPRIKKQWFASTPVLDQEIFKKYAKLWKYAASGGLDDWSDTAEGSLALIIILDQFPLNMFRNQAVSFSTEEKAIEVAAKAIKKNFQYQIEKNKRSFLFMPFMHSENLDDQNLSVKLYRLNELEANYRFAEHHREIIKKYGRFPHRNKILGRQSTDKEIVYLTSKEAFTG